MAKLFKQLILAENQRQANRAIGFAIDTINEVYKEWKKIKRRRNAVSIVETSVNKLCKLNPELIDHVHDTAKVKLAVVIMRCLNLPPWMDVETKRITYRRLYPLLSKVQGVSPNTGTGGKLRDALASQFSAAICQGCDDLHQKNTFVSYEPKTTKRYLRYIFGDEMPQNVCKMQTLTLPEDFDTLINTLRINHEKACEKYEESES